MSAPPLQIDVTTAADFKGLFQTIIVRRFKDKVGVRYDMAETDDILKFESFATLYNIAEGHDYFSFPSTGTTSKTGEKFKAKKASQQAAAEIGIQLLNVKLRQYPPIPYDQGESSHHYTYQAGLALLGSPNLQLGSVRGAYELVNKRDWKGQLQTTLLRKYKGQVDIRYTSTQAVRTDKFHATVILTHLDPKVGSCQVIGSYESTKKASEKTAAEKACAMVDLDTLVFTPQTADRTSKDYSDIRDYSARNDTVQMLGTALKGLFGNNYTTPAPIAPPVISPCTGLPWSGGDDSLPLPQQDYSPALPSASMLKTLGIDSPRESDRKIYSSKNVIGDSSTGISKATDINMTADSTYSSTLFDDRLRGGIPISNDSFENNQYLSLGKLDSGTFSMLDDSSSYITQGHSRGSYRNLESRGSIKSQGYSDVLAMSEVGSSITDKSGGESHSMSKYNREAWSEKEHSYLAHKDSLLSNPTQDFGGCSPRPPCVEDRSPGVTQKPALGRVIPGHNIADDPMRAPYFPREFQEQSHVYGRAAPHSSYRGNMGANTYAYGPGPGPGPGLGRPEILMGSQHSFAERRSPVGPFRDSIDYRDPIKSVNSFSRSTNSLDYSRSPINPIDLHDQFGHSTEHHGNMMLKRENMRDNVILSGVPIKNNSAPPGFLEDHLIRMVNEAKNLNLVPRSPYQTPEPTIHDNYPSYYPNRNNQGPGPGPSRGGHDQWQRSTGGRFGENIRSNRANSNITPTSISSSPGYFGRPAHSASSSSRPSSNYRDLDSSSDSKSRSFSNDDGDGNKATDWKGELQTFLARNCKDFPFKIEYNSDERVASGKFKARVTITFDNKEEEIRVVHGVPAVNKKATERAAAEIALEMFHARELSIPCQQGSLLIGKEGLNFPTEDSLPSCKYTPSYTGDPSLEKDSAVKDWKGRLQMLLARRYRGVLFKISYDAPKSLDGIFKAMLIIIPVNVQDLLLKVCEGKSSRVKKISEQSVAETAVRMLEADTLEVPSAASEKYRISAMESEYDIGRDRPLLPGQGPMDDLTMAERYRRSLEQRKPRRLLHLNTERNDSACYFMDSSSFLFFKNGGLKDNMMMVPDGPIECMPRHRMRTDRTVPLLLGEKCAAWKEKFISRLTDKFHAQLERYPPGNEELDTLKFMVNFGHAYFMNAAACFEGDKSLSVSNLEDALDSSVKNRTTVDRADFVIRCKDNDRSNASTFTSHFLSSSSPSSFSSSNNSVAFNRDIDYDDNSSVSSPVPVPDVTYRTESESGSDFGHITYYNHNPHSLDDMHSTSNTENTSLDPRSFSDDRNFDPDYSEVAEGSVDRNKKSEKRRRGIASGFKSSVYDQRIGAKGLGSSYEAASHFLSGLLVSLGYAEVKESLGQEHWEGRGEGAEILFGALPAPLPSPFYLANPFGVNCKWQVRVLPSTSYQVDVRLTPSLEVVSVMERSLCFINGALLHSTPLSPNLALSSVQNTSTIAVQSAPLVGDEARLIVSERSDDLNINKSRNFIIKSTTASNWFPVKETTDENGTKESNHLLPLITSVCNPNLNFTDLARQELSLHTPIRLGDSTCGNETNSLMKTPSTNSSEMGRLTAPWNDARTLSGATTVESRNLDHAGRNFTDSSLSRDQNPASVAILPSPLSPVEERKSILGGHDVRVKLTTTKILLKGEDLYDTACPDGSPPIIVDQRTGRPSPAVYTKAAQRVVSAKKLIEYKVFQLDQTVPPYGHGHGHGREASMSVSVSVSLPPAAVVATSSPPAVAARRTAVSSPEDPFGDRNLKRVSEGGDKSSSHRNDDSSSSNNNDNNSNNNYSDNTNTNKIVSHVENDIKLKMTAILSKYQHFGGEALEEAESLVDLALEVDCSPLIAYLRIGKKETKESMKLAINQWLGQAVEHVLSLSDSIEVENTFSSNFISDGKK